jgi:putative membrane protein
MAMMWHGDWSWAAWTAMSATMLGFWMLVIWGAVALTRRTGTETGPPSRGNADEILAERFARGEIDENEFRARNDLLRRGR